MIDSSKSTCPCRELIFMESAGASEAKTHVMAWSFDDESDESGDAIPDRLATNAHAWNDTISLARGHNLSAYDAASLGIGHPTWSAAGPH